jgi:hypothetical protein
MDWQVIIGLIVRQIEERPSVEGVYLSGSLANANRDAFSDLDLGIASGNSAADFEQVFALKDQILAAIGQPLHRIERGWDHCKLIAALYGKSLFPPIGLEVDVVFSQLQYVAEQMPYADYVILYDREGGLKRALDRIGHHKPEDEIAQEIRSHLRGCPFFVYDALKAYERQDLCSFQSLLEEMRKGIFYVASLRGGNPIYGSKRVFRHLSAAERQGIENSYHRFSRETVEQLADLFTGCLAGVQSNYRLEPDVQQLRSCLREIL